jgi:hypothetical protein
MPQTHTKRKNDQKRLETPDTPRAVGSYKGLSLRQAMRRLRVGFEVLHRLIETGALKAEPLPGYKRRLRITEESIAAYLGRSDGGQEQCHNTMKRRRRENDSSS